MLPGVFAFSQWLFGQDCRAYSESTHCFTTLLSV
jgi:hypothetical protein